MHEISASATGATEPEPSGQTSDDKSASEARTRKWQYYGAENGGNSQVIKEIKKERLQAAEVARLEDVMNRVLAGETLPKDVKDLGDGVLEFKLHLDRRSYRMVYAEVADGFVLLALTFFRKTKPRQPKDIERARERLKTYLRATDGQE